MGFKITGNSTVPPPAPSIPDYSLDEQIYFRKWIDGRDIYEKTIPVSFSDDGITLVVDNIPNIDWIIDVDFSVRSGPYLIFLSSHQIEPIMNVSISVWVEGNEVRLKAYSSPPLFLSFEGYLFLRYTKKKKKM